MCPPIAGIGEAFHALSTFKKVSTVLSAASLQQGAASQQEAKRSARKATKQADTSAIEQAKGVAKPRIASAKRKRPGRRGLYV